MSIKIIILIFHKINKFLYLVIFPNRNLLYISLLLIFFTLPDLIIDKFNLHPGHLENTRLGIFYDKISFNFLLYSLSEILVKFNSDQDYINLTDKIKKSIQEIGFNNTASIYSISDTANKGGKIGWVDQISLSPKILNGLENLKKGENTQPIKLSNNFLFLRIEDVEITNIKFDLEKVLNRRIMGERNKQLDQFSNIFFNRVKQNIKIDG